MEVGESEYLEECASKDDEDPIRGTKEEPEADVRVLLRKYGDLILQFRKANVHFQQMSSIPPGEFTMLLMIVRLTAGKAEVMASDLGRAMNLSRPAVSRMLHTLRGKGYVNIDYRLEDHRCVQIEITEQGRRRITDEMKKWRQLMHRVTERMGEEDMEHFLYYNRKFCTILAEESV